MALILCRIDNIFLAYKDLHNLLHVDHDHVEEGRGPDVDASPHEIPHLVARKPHYEQHTCTDLISKFEFCLHKHTHTHASTHASIYTPTHFPE